MALTEYQQEGRAAWIEGMKQLLAWYHAHPEFPAPIHADNRVLIYAMSREEFVEWRRAGGFEDKVSTDDYMEFHFKLAGGIEIQLYTKKENTCRRVQVGTEVIAAIPEHVVAAQPAREVPVFAWECDEPLLAPREPEQPAVDAMPNL